MSCHHEVLLQGQGVGPLRFGVLNARCQPEIKHRTGHTDGPHRQVEGRDLMKAWDTEGETVRFSVRAS